ncbi:MAG: hypothetical protein Aurels2KO_12630 [Aureliella sp.]
MKTYKNEKAVSNRRSLRVESLEDRRVLATFLVTTNSDFGAGSLRDAMEQSNATPGLDEIRFSLPTSELKITPESALPWLTDAVLIDATTQPGYSGLPLVELSGENAVGNAAGIHIAADNSSVRGLTINSFTNAGIYVGEVSGILIRSNIIGADPSGEIARPNAQGISLYGTTNAIVGGGAPEFGNLISGNDGYGIVVGGSAATNNRIQSNIIGANITGTKPLPNTSSGVFVDDGARDNYVGTDSDGVRDAAEGNLISGNGGHGVIVRSAHSNVVAGNFVGTDIDGVSAIGNSFHGVQMTIGASENMIGGSSPTERNVISGNGRAGVQTIGAVSNHIAGNFIGVDVSGTKALGNDEYGILLRDDSESNVVGTNGDGVNDAAERNLISGNRYAGIFSLKSHKNVVAGNYIGVDASGSGRAANNVGVRIHGGSTLNLVGTNADGVSDELERNIIAGNVRNGVEIDDASNNQVAGNWIGLGSDGVAVPNRHSGVWIHSGATGNTIGGASDARRNVISGNAYSGVSTRAPDNTIIGNYIGTSVDGMQAIGNQWEAVLVYDDATGTRVGDGTSAGRNVIFSGVSDGVHIRNASANSVVGNWIGVAADGTTHFADAGTAVRLTDAGGNTIGGAAADQFNTIYSGDESAVIVAGDSTNNSLHGMSVASTNVAPVDLGGDGVTTNDDSDGDAGPNGLQNFPDILSANTSDGVTRIAGRIASSPGSQVDVDLYFSSAETPDTILHVGRVQSVQTGPDGIGAWSIELPGDVGSFRAIASQDMVGSSELSPAVSTARQLEVKLETYEMTEQDFRLSGFVARDDESLQEPVVVNLSSTDPARVKVPEQVIIPAGDQVVGFTIELVGDSLAQPTLDVAILAESSNASGAALLTILRSDTWHNDVLALDVNGDSSIAPNDVLGVVNAINSGIGGDLAGQTPRDQGRFVDTNDDGFLSPIDALIIINYLNKPDGEGESTDEIAGGTWSTGEFFDLSWVEDLKKSRQWPAR